MEKKMKICLTIEFKNHGKFRKNNQESVQPHHC